MHAKLKILHDLMYKWTHTHTHTQAGIPLFRAARNSTLTLLT